MSDRELGRGMLAEFRQKFGADAPLAEEMVYYASQGGRSPAGCIVAALKVIYGDDVEQRTDYDDRLREGVRVMKALDAHGIFQLPPGLFT